MSTDEPRPSRRQLLAELMQAGREQSNAIVMYHSAVAARLGLSTTDEKILDLLEREGPLTAGDLVQRTRLAPSSITAAIDRLQHNGFVHRRPHAQDRRRVTVELRHESLKGAPDLFADLARRLKKLYASYNDDELAAVLRFMRDATSAQRAATEELTKPSP